MLEGILSKRNQFVSFFVWSEDQVSYVCVQCLCAYVKLPLLLYKTDFSHSFIMITAFIPGKKQSALQSQTE